MEAFKMSVRCRYCNKDITSIIAHRLTCEAEHTKWRTPKKYLGRHKLKNKYQLNKHRRKKTK
jgi:hypothetical protein